MKKILSCLGVALFTFSFSYSQEIKNKDFSGKEATLIMAQEEVIPAGELKNRQPVNPVINAPGDTVYSETFAGPGLPSGWTQSGTNLFWKHINPSYVNGGCYSAGTARLNSTTSINGTMIFDADSANKAINDPACSSGGANYKAFTGSLVSGTIDLTGKAGVYLKYQQRFRLCCNTTTTKITTSVSGDGGANWTDFDSRHGVNLNQSPLTNPDNMVINISAVAGNKSNVMIKFTFTSESGTYYWELDDVAIVQSYDDELVLSKAYVMQGYNEGTAGFYGGYYTMTPIKQVAQIVEFKGAIANDGVNAQSNVYLNATVSGPVTYNQSSAMTTSAANAKDTLKITVPFTPSLKGTYNTTFTLFPADQNSANNTVLKVFEITDSVYARDAGTPTPYGTSLTPSNYVGGNVNEGGLGNYYEMYQNDVAVAVQFYLNRLTGIGASLEAGIYAATSAISPSAQASSAIYDVTDSVTDAGMWVTLPLVTGNTVLMKDSSYIVGVKNYNEATTTTRMRISSDLVTEQSNATSWVRYLPTGMTTFSWGWITVQPRIRLITTFGVGIPKIASGGIRLDQNVPNPSNGQTMINYEINKFSNVTLEVYDITGKLVFSQNEGSVAAGKHSIELNTHLAAGAYSYTLRANEASLTKKMIVTQ